MPERSRQHRQETHRLKPLPTCGEMLVSWKVSSSAFCEPLWFAAGACVHATSARLARWHSLSEA